MISGNDDDVAESGADLATHPKDAVPDVRPRRSEIHRTTASWSLPPVSAAGHRQVRSALRGLRRGRFATLDRPRLLLVAAAVLALIALPFVLHDGGHHLTGTIETPTSSNAGASTCEAAGEYADIGEGAQVVVRGPHGELLGLGTLSAGTPVGSDLDRGCAFSFDVPGLPRSGFYTVSTGSSSLGAMHYSHEDLSTAGWHATLELKR